MLPELREVSGAWQVASPFVVVQRLEHRPERDVVIGTEDDIDRVAGADVPFLHDAQVRAHSTDVLEPSGEARIAEPDAELEAGEPDLRDLEDRGSDCPAFANQCARQVDPFDGEILAEQRRLDVEPFVGAPVLIVLS
ncbi:MAG TPA: hypothetical protein VF461_14045 [Gemmatimonadaceae bacterium]